MQLGFPPGPKRAQEIWLSAFNNGVDEYGEKSRAARVAWAAVKNAYHKTPAGHWVKS